MMLRSHPRGRDGSGIESELNRPSPSFMSPQQFGQQPSAHFTSRSAKASSPSRSGNSHGNWTADYLNDLRSNRPTRPGGARPIPSDNEKPCSPKISLFPERAASALGMRDSPVNARHDYPERSTSALSHRRTQSTMGPRDPPGRPVARSSATREVSTSTVKTTSSRTSHFSSPRQYTIPYYERGQRWMEKQEVSSLRQALEDKDIEEENKIHVAAQNEASDLVWKHRNPDSPYKNPDRPDYKQHLRKGSHAQSQCVGPFETLYVAKEGSSEGSRSASDGSNSNQSGRSFSNGSQRSGGSTSSKKSYSNLSFSMRSRQFFSRKGSKSNRNISGQSGATVLRYSEDKIYEEPDDIVVTSQDNKEPLALKPKARNTSYGSYEAKGKSQRTDQTSPGSLGKVKAIVDIHRNPPSQSRNGQYQRNPNPMPSSEPYAMVENNSPRSRDGKEVRSDDIRAATSMRLKDRSTKLPMPAVVSDRPGRPIVSFDDDWKPREKELKHETSTSDPSLENHRERRSGLTKPPMPQAVRSAPVVPTINLPDPLPSSKDMTVPVISVSESPSICVNPHVPSISVSSETPEICLSGPVPTINISSQYSSGRPLPQPAKRPNPSQRPLPTHAATAPIKSAPHWSPAPSRAQAQCAACALPISGRIVSAATQRFHPHCFTCYQCGELLECVAFYPEPDIKRSERLARIQARMTNQPLPSDQAQYTEEDDGDDSLRFYCHLDFHEKFSPRCRSCKTPIEGEVILACGGEWHVGHFFCAECGDPFEKDVPFVEKEGFAWCVECHTKRYSGKCAGCRKAVTDVVVNALGKEWHENCFCCKVSGLRVRQSKQDLKLTLNPQECGGQFEDGCFFTRGDSEMPICVSCEERRLKA